jgi:polyisoprenoid-binding protein YceI
MTQTLTQTATSTYQIDKVHSEVTFQVRHLLTKVRGHFSDFSGSLTFDEQNVAGARADITIQAASIDTRTVDRDNHLRSADFFDVEKYPTLTFKSLSASPRSPQSFDVLGDLTIHGITKKVTLPVEYLGRAKDPWGNEKAMFEAELTINRKDFGLAWNALLETGGFAVGDEVKIALSIQAGAVK